MTNPYDAPKAKDVDDEKNIGGGFFTIKGSKSLDCTGAWLSVDKRFLRFEYLPTKSKKLILILFCIVMVIQVPFVILGGIGAIIAFLMIKIIVGGCCASKVEFDIDEEDLMIDTNRRTIGVRKIQNGKPVFLGSQISGDLLDQLRDGFPYTETVIKKGNRNGYQLIAIGIWLCGVLGGMWIRSVLGFTSF